MFKSVPPLILLCSIGCVGEHPPAARPVDEILGDGWQAIEQRDTSRLTSVIDELEAAEATTEQLPLLRGARSLFSGVPTSALRHFAEVPPAGSHRQVLLMLTAEALHATGQLLEAEGCLRALLADSPDNANAHRRLAAIYFDLGSMNEALIHLEELSRLVPDDYRPYLMKGVIYLDYERLGEASIALSTALEKSNDQAGPIQNSIVSKLVETWFRQNEYEAALRLLNKFEHPDPTLKAECHWNLGQTELAREAMSQLITPDSTLPIRGRLLAARIHLEDNKPESAIPLLQMTVREQPWNNEAEYLLAMSWQLSGDQDKHMLHLNRSDEIKKAKSQLTELSNAAIQEPFNAEIRDQLAAICGDLGMEKMKRVWQSAARACRSRQPPDSDDESIKMESE